MPGHELAREVNSRATLLRRSRLCLSTCTLHYCVFLYFCEYKCVYLFAAQLYNRLFVRPSVRPTCFIITICPVPWTWSLLNVLFQRLLGRCPATCPCWSCCRCPWIQRLKGTVKLYSLFFCFFLRLIPILGQIIRLIMFLEYGISTWKWSEIFFFWC